MMMAVKLKNHINMEQIKKSFLHHNFILILSYNTHLYIQNQLINKTQQWIRGPLNFTPLLSSVRWLHPLVPSTLVSTRLH
jgi:hypothetical protein